MYYDGANWRWDKKEDGVKWCNHLDDFEKYAFYSDNENGVSFPLEIFGMKIKFCPVCGTPRPAEKRKLADAFSEFPTCVKETSDGRGFNMVSLTRATQEGLAEICMKRVCEEIDEYSEHRTTPNSGAGIFAKGLKQRLKETLL
jgi:hypothetical protein